jgi:hypothetical protein
MKTYWSKALLLVAALFGFSQISFAACDMTLSSGANVASAVTNVASGGTVCLSAGSYPAFGSSVVKSSMTTITPAPGVTQSQVTLGSANVGTSQNLQFENMTIGGGSVGTGSSPGLHIHFVGIKFTGPLCINNPTNINQDTLVDSSTFAGLGTSCTEGRLGVNGNNVSHSVPSGIVISNNVFGPGGCSDGIQIVGGANGVQMLNNEFVGIKQGSCDPVHADPIQFYGAIAPVVTGNYFHGNSTGIMSAGCNGSNGTYTNNVFVTDGEYPDQIVQTGPNGGTYDHNTFGNGAKIRFGDPNHCGLVTNVTLTNNIMSGGLDLTEGQGTSTFKISYNIGTGGANAISGTPTYVGGSLPSTWTGWQLASGSVGKGAASDGKDVGATTFGPARSDLPAPSNLRVQ